MAEYTPAYRLAQPLTIEHLEARVEELERIHAYATKHDDMFVLDELFCCIVALEHRIIAREQEQEHGARVGTSLKELDRALKWAWLAREEEEHANGMYAGKLQEAIAVLRDLYTFLDTLHRAGIVPPRPQGMSKDEAEALARTIKTRLPGAQVVTRAEDGGAFWIVEAKNPRRGTSQVFRRPEEFDQLLQQAARPSSPPDAS